MSAIIGSRYTGEREKEIRRLCRNVWWTQVQQRGEIKIRNCLLCPPTKTCKTHLCKVKVEDREYTVSTDPAEWSAVERYKSFRKRSFLVVCLQVHKYVYTPVNPNAWSWARKAKWLCHAYNEAWRLPLLCQVIRFPFIWSWSIGKCHYFVTRRARSWLFPVYVSQGGVSVWFHSKATF